MRKYELTDETQAVLGQTLHRIRALRDFNDVKAGDLGGWVAGPDNLSQHGNCWAYDNSRMSGDSRMSGNSRMSGDSRMYDNSFMTGDSQLTGVAKNLTGFIHNVTITDGHIIIGCQCHTPVEWESFSDEDIAEMDKVNAKLWPTMKPLILGLARAAGCEF